MLYTRVKQKITDRLGARWTCQQIAREAGLLKEEATQAVTCTGDDSCRARHGERIQTAVAKAIGIPVGELFGEHAWFRLAADGLKKRREKGNGKKSG